jgi:hypothetical protein
MPRKKQPVPAILPSAPAEPTLEEKLEDAQYKADNASQMLALYNTKVNLYQLQLVEAIFYTDILIALAEVVPPADFAACIDKARSENKGLVSQAPLD